MDEHGVSLLLEVLDGIRDELARANRLKALEMRQTYVRMYSEGWEGRDDDLENACHAEAEKEG